MTEEKILIIGDLKEFYRDLGTWPKPGQLPIVYSRLYNISFLGLERWNALDAWKFHNVFSILEKNELIQKGEHPMPLIEVPDALLLELHDEKYIFDVYTSKMAVIQIIELPILFLLPNFLVQRNFIRPLKMQVTGTILAVGIAIEKGWSINLGGGLIHASHDQGAGWCPFDDITIAIRYARQATNQRINRFLIIDLGAHQGNGYQNNKLRNNDDDILIVDVYNYMIFPKDEKARPAINIERRLSCRTTSQEYMDVVSDVCKEAAGLNFDFIIYVAGTDVMEIDFSGQFSVTSEDIVKRDHVVFDLAVEKRVPICMLLSSGYNKNNAEIVADSISDIIKNR